MTTVHVVVQWEDDHTTAVVGIFSAKAIADAVADQEPTARMRTVESYELDEIEEWAKR